MAGEDRAKFMGVNALGKAVYEVPAELASALRRRLAVGDAAGQTVITHVAYPGKSYYALPADTDHQDSIQWGDEPVEHHVPDGWEAIALIPTTQALSALFPEVPPEQQ